MKKDIEWLKKEIATEMTELEPNRKERWSDVKYQTLRDVAQKLDQLDEPEVTLNRTFEKIAEAYPMTREEVCRHLEKVIAYGGKVTYGEPEVLSQELPVIPKYVADWIEENRERYENDFFSISCDLFDDYIQSGVDDWMTENEEKFLRAWLDGYTIAEEPLYYALIKGHELLSDEDAWACNYWNLSALDGCVFPSDKSSSDGLFSTKMTKSKWNKVGINDSNADFVKAEEDE